MFPVYNLNVHDKPGPAFGSMEYVSTKPILDKKMYDNLNYDEEVNRLLDQVKEEFLRDKPENESFPEGTREVSRDKPKNYDFPEDTHHVGSIPNWYRDMLKNKIKEAKSRLVNLSNLVCATSPSTAAHIKRIEEDHSTTFCKMDYPRHPPMHKSWRSTWEFRYTNDSHCERLVVEDFETGVRMDDPNICQHDYPPHVTRVATLFRNFAKKLNQKISQSKGKEKSECKENSKCKEKSKGIQNVDKIEDDWWTTVTMVLISNHLNELMIVVRREKVKHLLPHLKAYFEHACRENPNIVSVWGFHTKKNLKTRQWLMKGVTKDDSKKMLLIAGTPVLKEEIGPLSMQYDLANHRVFFDSVQTMQLGKVIQDYMCLTKETTLLDIGSNFGVLSLIMAHKCEKVIKLTPAPRAKWQINESEKLKKANTIQNVTFLEFNTENIITMCAPLIKQCITVAIVKLNSNKPVLGGPLEDVMRALRNLPSVWRVIIYGSFADELHESIAVLASEDDSMGERYLPMQGCILDKSPTIVDAFDLVVLFERKSLIAPNVELFAPGPTVNVAVDSEMRDDGSLDAVEVKLELSLDGDQELANSKQKCEERLPLSTVTNKKSQLSEDNQSHRLLSIRKEFQCNSSPAPAEKFRDGKPQQPTDDQPVPPLPEINEFRLDHPPPPLGTFPPFSHPPPSVAEKFQFNFPAPPFQKAPPFNPNPSGPMREYFQNDYPPFLDSRFPNPHFHPDPYPPTREDFRHGYPPLHLESRFPNPHSHPEHYPPVREDLLYNCPLPLLQRHFNVPILQDPHPQNDFQDHYYPPLPPENYYNSTHHPVPRALVGNEFKNHFPTPPPPSPLLSTLHPVFSKTKNPSQPNKKKPQFFYPPPPPARFPSPPPPPPFPPLEETDLLEKDSSISSSSTTVTDEPMQVCEEEKVSEIVNTADVISSVVIKSESIDPSYSADLSEASSSLSEANCDSLTTIVKDELAQVCEKKASEKVNSVEDVVSTVSIKLEPIDTCYSANLLEANGPLLEANRYSPTTAVKTEPLQDEEKKESNVADCGTTVKAEIKAESLQDEERKESNVTDSGTSSSVTIKSEPTNQSSSINFSDTNCQSTALPVSTQSELTAFSPIKSPDCEPMDMQISPSPPDFHSMETPIHNPRALSDISPLSVSKNVSVNGSEFPVQTNQSFLSKVKLTNVDREPGEISDSDGENEEKDKQQNKLPQKHVSTALVVSRKLNRPPRPFPGEYSESSHKRRNHRRSPSPKRMRRSPTPDRRRRRSPVSDRRGDRSRRSPLREAYGRARSPRDRRNRRSRSRSPRRR